MIRIRNFLAAALAAVIALGPIPALADTVTTNLGLTQPGIGADDAAWGGLLNTDLSLVDAEYARTTVGDAAYTVLAADRFVALTAALTAPRTWTLPAASSRKTGQAVVVLDEAGGIGATNTLTIAAAGVDTINGAATLVLNTARQVVVLRSDGTSKWTVLGTSAAACALTGCTLTGKVTTAASATGGAGLNLPQGTAPTSPGNGDLWTTSTGVFAQIAGATQALANGVLTTWTPVLTFATPGNLSVAYSTQSGSAVQFSIPGANLCYATFSIATSTFTFTTASGALQITGLPYGASNVNQTNLGASGGLGTWSGMTGLTSPPVTNINGSGSTTILMSFGTNSSASVTASNFTTATNVTLKGSLLYRC